MLVFQSSRTLKSSARACFLEPVNSNVMYKKIITIIFLVNVSFVTNAQNDKLTYLGVMPHDCKKISQSQNVRLPEFKLSPLEAAKIVKSNSKFGCFVKMGFGVYADNKYYYYSNNNLLFGKSTSNETIKKYSFIVEAQSGKLISKPSYE